MMGNWDDLRLFLAVAREQSLSGAGKLLRLDPATLGRRMARLEKTMQAVLFVKSPSGYALTEAGVQLLSRAEAAEQAMRQATADVVVPSDQLAGQIRIGAPDGCANYLLPQVCARLVADNPGLDIQIVALPRVANFLLPQVCTRIHDQNPDLEIQIVALPRLFNLSRREADMAIGVSAPTAGRLVVQKIADYQLHLAAADSYLAARPAIRTVADLQGHRLVGYIPDMIFDRELDYLAELGMTRVPLASNSVSVQVNMIRQGGGVGIVHDFSLPATPGVTRILTGDVHLSRAFYLIRHEDDRRNLRLSRFAEALAQGVRAEVAKLEAIA